MMNRIKLIGLTSLYFLILVSFTHVYSDVIDRNSGIDFNLMLLELTDWLDNNYEFNRDDVPIPKIKITDIDNLCKMAYQDYTKRIDEEGCSHILGLYNNNEKTIYVNETVDLNRKEGRAIILHELVHHYQFECGLTIDITCLADLEELSYLLEEKYLGKEIKKWKD